MGTVGASSGVLNRLAAYFLQRCAPSTCKLLRYRGAEGAEASAFRCPAPVSVVSYSVALEGRENVALYSSFPKEDEGRKCGGFNTGVALSLRSTDFRVSRPSHLLLTFRNAVERCGGAGVSTVASSVGLSRAQLRTSSSWRFEQRLNFASVVSEKPTIQSKDATEEAISVTFVGKDGDEKEIRVPVGMSMLEAAHENDIELEGACEGSVACSTCHVIVMEEDYYNKLPEPSDEENDMLDLAFGLTEVSRLGCQVIAKPELDGLRLALPAATRNFAVDGHVPKPH